MKLNLLFIGLKITLISMQICWDDNEATQSAAAAVRPIEVISDAKESNQSFQAAGYSEVMEFSDETSGESTQANEEPHGWFIGERDDEWTAGEWEMIQEIISDTFNILETANLDGETLLSGYRFKRIFSEYLDPVAGKIAVINHNLEEIWLSDAAFRMSGFYIYHELGHAVDHRLERQLSQAFHARTGGKFVDGGNGEKWQSGDAFWMRTHGREDREEATADAFALSVIMSETTNRKPIFSGMPVTVDYSGIADAVSESLIEIGTDFEGRVSVAR